MAEATPATVALTRAGVAFTLHEYDSQDADGESGRRGLQIELAPAELVRVLDAAAVEL